jgi:transcriptional repressor NrdR
MFCPYCNSSKIRVIDKRDSEDNRSIRRRRECLDCKNRFTTYERIRSPLKRDKSKENFNREKIKAGMLKALKGRPVNEKKLEKVLDEIESEIKTMNCMEIKSKMIGDIVTEKLKKFDKVAYVRFMSHYKDFKDVKTFKKALR